MQSASTNITTFPGKVGISNANPTHTLAIGSNVYVEDTGSNKLTVTGVISGDGLGISNIQTANVLGLTDNVSRISTLETDLGDNSSRITNLSSNLSDNSSRISTLSSDLSDNSSRITNLSSNLSDNSSRISTLSSDLSDNSSRITNLSSNLSDNSSRITDLSSNLSDNSSRIDSLETGAYTFTGVKTFQDDIILESNLRVNGSLTYANTVNMIVSDPIIELGANNQHTNDLGLVLTRHGNSGNDSNVAIFYDETADNLKIGYTDDGASQTTLSTTATGLDVSITGNVAAAYNADETSYFGRAAVGYMGQSDQASFSHIDKNTSTDFALKQAASGATHLNTPTGQHIRFSVNASEVGRFTGGGDFKVGSNKLYVDTSASEVQMYSQATGSTAGPDLLLMRDNGSGVGANNQYIGQIRYEGLSSTGTSRLYAKTTGKIKTATNGSEDGVIETMIKTGGSNRLSVRHSGDKFLIQKGTDLQVGEVANLYVDTSTSRVGIGKSNPSYTLDVDGDINLSGDFYQGGSPFVSSLWTSSGTDLYYNSGSVGISNAAPDHDLSVGSNLYVHDTGSNVLVVDGNVNVSNTISTHRLTLNNVSITTTMDLGQVSNVGNVTSNVLQFTNPTTAFVTTGNVEVGTANLFVDTTTSSVGIGTTSPDTKLHLYDTTTEPTIAFQHLSANENNSSTNILGNLCLHRSHRSGVGNQVGIRSIRRANTHDDQADMEFYVRNGGHGEQTAMVINSGGNANSAKVGIGTTDPKSALHVTGAVNYNNQNTPGVEVGVHDSTYAAIEMTSTANQTSWIDFKTTSSNSDYVDRIRGGLGDLQFFTNNGGERMRIDSTGNVGIDDSSPSYKLDVNGSIGVSGKQMYPMLRWEIDLTSQSNSNFYPIEFTHPFVTNLPDMHPIHFKVFGDSLSGSNPYNENTLVGYAKGGGYTDHGPMYDVHIRRYTAGEHRFQGLYEGTTGAYEQIVIYMRGGYQYSAITDATSVVTHTSAYTVGSGSSSATFAIKNSSGTDVSGTSSAIWQLVNLAANARHAERFTSGDLNVSGSMTISNLPRWRVNYGTSSGNITSTGTILWTNADIDNRSGYSATTGLYTAQEDGHYYIYCHMYTQTTDDDAEISFLINGNTGPTIVGSAYSRAGEAERYTNLVLMSNLDLNVNDTVGVHVGIANVHYNARGISYFGGYKVC